MLRVEITSKGKTKVKNRTLLRVSIEDVILLLELLEYWPLLIKLAIFAIRTLLRDRNNLIYAYEEINTNKSKCIYVLG